MSRLTKVKSITLEEMRPPIFLPILGSLTYRQVCSKKSVNQGKSLNESDRGKSLFPVPLVISARLSGETTDMTEIAVTLET